MNIFSIFLLAGLGLSSFAVANKYFYPAQPNSYIQYDSVPATAKIQPKFPPSTEWKHVTYDSCIVSGTVYEGTNILDILGVEIEAVVPAYYFPASPKDSLFAQNYPNAKGLIMGHKILFKSKFTPPIYAFKKFMHLKDTYEIPISNHPTDIFLLKSHQWSRYHYLLVPDSVSEYVHKEKLLTHSQKSIKFSNMPSYKYIQRLPSDLNINFHCVWRLDSIANAPSPHLDSAVYWLRLTLVTQNDSCTACMFKQNNNK
jgi:hypothetical protein